MKEFAELFNFDENEVRKYSLKLNQAEHDGYTALADKHNLSTTGVLRNFVLFGFLLDSTKRGGTKFMLEKRQELELFANEQKNTKNKEPWLSISIKRAATYRITMSIPVRLSGELQEMANRYKKTVEEVLKQFFDVGLSTAQRIDENNCRLLFVKNNGFESEHDLFQK